MVEPLWTMPNTKFGRMLKDFNVNDGRVKITDQIVQNLDFNIYFCILLIRLVLNLGQRIKYSGSALLAYGSVVNNYYPLILTLIQHDISLLL